MKQEFAHFKGKSLDKQRGAQSQPSGDAKTAPKRAAVASSIAKPEFKKHVHTNSSKSKADEPAAEAPLSRRQLKNLAKRKKKEAAAAEAAAAAGHDASLPPSSSTPHPAQPSSASGGTATAAAKAKKAPLDPGKKAEVNCNWQALKKALVSGGPIITRLPLTARFSFAAQRVRLSLLTPPPPSHPTPSPSRSSTTLNVTTLKPAAAGSSAPSHAAPAACAAVPGVGLGGAAFASTSSIVALDCEMVAGTTPLCLPADPAAVCDV